MTFLDEILLRHPYDADCSLIQAGLLDPARQDLELRFRGRQWWSGSAAHGELVVRATDCVDVSLRFGEFDSMAVLSDHPRLLLYNAPFSSVFSATAIDTGEFLKSYLPNMDEMVSSWIDPISLLGRGNVREWMSNATEGPSCIWTGPSPLLRILEQWAQINSVRISVVQQTRSRHFNYKLLELDDYFIVARQFEVADEE